MASYRRMSSGDADSENLIEQPDKTNQSILQKFYKNKCVFVAGAGFLEKVLIIKLLQFCPNIEKIYVFLVVKHKTTLIKSVKNFFKHPLFSEDKIKNCVEDKVGFIATKSITDLEFTEAEKSDLKKVSIFFYTAGIKELSENKGDEYDVNYLSFRMLLEFCENLEAVVYVSTACSIPNKEITVIKETFDDKIGEYDEQSEKFLKIMYKSGTNIKKIHPFHDLHTFTKTFAENQIKNKLKKYPIGIFRLGMLFASIDEYIKKNAGYTYENYCSGIGILVYSFLGLIRVVKGNPDVKANIIPVDMAANALIACAWDIATQKDRRNETALIYNFVTAEKDLSIDKTITWGDVHIHLEDQIKKNKDVKIFCYYNLKIVNSIMKRFFLYLWDTSSTIWIYIVVQKKIAHGYDRHRKYSQKAAKVLSYVSSNNWIYDTKNVRDLWEKLEEGDKRTLNFDVRSINWRAYFQNLIKNLRETTFRVSEEKSLFDRGFQFCSFLMHLLSRILILILIVYCIVWVVYSHYSDFLGAYEILHADEIVYDSNIEL